MDKQLNDAPCGFLALSEEGSIIAANRTLIKILDYEPEQVIGQHMNMMLTIPAQLFCQLYFFPLLKLEHHIEEIYISLKARDGEEIPVLINATARHGSGASVFDCVLIPMRKRNEYENELLIARNEAQEALFAKQKANAELEIALETLKAKQEELLEINKQNQQFKLNTKRELELARKIQKNSLTEPIVNDQVQIDSYYNASSELSGDLYGYYQIDEHRYGIIILDVMGHGISSALITMSLHPLFQRQITQGLSPVKVMKELDRHLTRMFPITLCFSLSVFSVRPESTQAPSRKHQVLLCPYSPLPPLHLLLQLPGLEQKLDMAASARFLVLYFHAHRHPRRYRCTMSPPP